MTSIPPNKCQHRDDGRGVCIDCGYFLDIYPSPEIDEDDDDSDACCNPGGHSWVYTGTAYGGDDESYHGEGRCYCEHCGADGDA